MVSNRAFWHLVAAPTGSPVGGAAARRAARAELRKAAYRHSGPDITTRIEDWVGRQFSHLFSGGGGSDALLIVLVVLLVAVVLLALRAGTPSRRSTLASENADPLAPVTSRDHRRIAAELGARGLHREAQREWLRAAVQTIEERGILPPRPGRTGAMTAREAGPLLPRAAEDLEIATTAFDEVWFGGRAATPLDVERARAAADAVTSARADRTSAEHAHPTGLEVPR